MLCSRCFFVPRFPGGAGGGEGAQKRQPERQPGLQVDEPSSKHLSEMNRKRRDQTGSLKEHLVLQMVHTSLPRSSQVFFLGRKQFAKALFRGTSSPFWARSCFANIKVPGVSRNKLHNTTPSPWSSATSHNIKVLSVQQITQSLALCNKLHPRDQSPVASASLAATSVRTFLANSLYDSSELQYTLRLDCSPDGRYQRSCDAQDGIWLQGFEFCDTPLPEFFCCGFFCWGWGRFLISALLNEGVEEVPNFRVVSFFGGGGGGSLSQFCFLGFEGKEVPYFRLINYILDLP